jgi:hypothetical protein
MRRSVRESCDQDVNTTIVQFLSWGEDPGWLCGFDLVLAADTAYGSYDVLLSLFTTAASALKPKGCLVLSLQHRYKEFSGILNHSLDFRVSPYMTVEGLIHASQAAGLELCSGVVPAALEEIQVFKFVKPG